MRKQNLKKLTLLTCLLPYFAHAELSINDDKLVDDGAGTGQAALVRPEQTRQAVPIPPVPRPQAQEQQSGLLIDGRAVSDDEPIVVRAEQPPPAPKVKNTPDPAELEKLAEQEAASLPEIPIELNSVDAGENARIVQSMAQAEKMTGIIDFQNPKDMEKVEAMKRYEHQKNDPLWLASQDPAMVWTVGIIWVLILLLVFAGFLYIMSRKRYTPLEQPQPYQPPPSRFNRFNRQATVPPPAGVQAPIMRRANVRPQPNPQRLPRPPY